MGVRNCAELGENLQKIVKRLLANDELVKLLYYEQDDPMGQSALSTEVKEQEVFLGDMPLMTESGTFVINGAERVIVSQLVRSPGAYFSKGLDKFGKGLYGGDIIPSRGTWLEFESDSKDLLWVKVDKARKILGTVILRAIGLEDSEEIKKILLAANKYGLSKLPFKIKLLAAKCILFRGMKMDDAVQLYYKYISNIGSHPKIALQEQADFSRVMSVNIMLYALNRLEKCF